MNKKSTFQVARFRNEIKNDRIFNLKRKDHLHTYGHDLQFFIGEKEELELELKTAESFNFDKNHLEIDRQKRRFRYKNRNINNPI